MNVYLDNLWHCSREDLKSQSHLVVKGGGLSDRYSLQFPGTPLKQTCGYTKAKIIHTYCAIKAPSRF